MPLVLRPMFQEHAHEAAEVVTAAFANNRFRAILFPNGPGPAMFDLTSARFSKAVDDPDSYPMHVYDTDAGKMAAIAIWKYTKAMTDEDWRRELEEVPGVNAFPDARQDVLRPFFCAEQAARRQLMKGERWWELDSLNTLPEYQGRGIGSMLMKWGIDRLEQMKMPSVVVSTEQGFEFYKKHGYKEVQRWDIDLGRWGGDGYYKNIILKRYPDVLSSCRMK